MGTCGVAAYKPYIGAVRPETRYAKSGDVSVAYQVIGEGSIDLVLVPGFVSHVELAWEEPNLARVLTRLASFSRLIIFDKRGTGMSDPMTAAPSMEARMDDIRAVMDAVGTPSAALFGISEGGSLSLLFARRHRERTRALILYGSWARRTAAPDYPWGPTAEQLEEMLTGMDRAWATGEWWDRVRRSPQDDERHQQWWARYLRMGASPTMARDVIRMNAQMDLRGCCRTLMSRRSSCIASTTAGSTWATVATSPNTSPAPNMSSYQDPIIACGWTTPRPSWPSSRSSSSVAGGAPGDAARLELQLSAAANERLRPWLPAARRHRTSPRTSS